MIKYNKIDKEWWELIDDTTNQKVGWIRLTMLVICNKKYCNIDSGKCGHPENIVKTIPKYGFWLHHQEIQLTDSLDEATKLINRQ